MSQLSLQEKYSPKSICFGCGPANPDGLHIRSFLIGDEVIAEWMPKPHHQAFPGALNGGIIGALLDCHCNWAAVAALMKETKSDTAPATVTADYQIKMMAPTPVDKPIQLRAKAVEIKGSRVVVEGQLIANGKTCATCRGTFVAVKPDHPAFHRW